jgi:hypothetical protein
MTYLRINNIDGTKWGKALEFRSMQSFPLGKEYTIFDAKIIGVSLQSEPYKIEYDLLVKMRDQKLTVNELELCLGFQKSFELQWVHDSL